MATKSVTISPAAAQAAGCSATCESYHSGVVPEQTAGGGTLHYTNFQAIARPKLGWRLKYWDVSHHYTVNDGTTHDETIRYTRPNPFPIAKEFSKFENPFEFEITGADPFPVITIKDEITAIVAEFETWSYVPTHLLVNTANMASPVALTYDPETHKLVADF